MLSNAYFLAKIGADTAANEQRFAEMPICRPAGGGLRHTPHPETEFHLATPTGWAVSKEILIASGRRLAASTLPVRALIYGWSFLKLLINVDLEEGRLVSGDVQVFGSSRDMARRGHRPPTGRTFGPAPPVGERERSAKIKLKIKKTDFEN